MLVFSCTTIQTHSSLVHSITSLRKTKPTIVTTLEFAINYDHPVLKPNQLKTSFLIEESLFGTSSNQSSTSQHHSQSLKEMSKPICYHLIKMKKKKPPTSTNRFPLPCVYPLQTTFPPQNPKLLSKLTILTTSIGLGRMCHPLLNLFNKIIVP